MMNEDINARLKADSEPQPIDTASSQTIAKPHVSSSVSVPAVRVRFYPKDVDETFDGTVIEETQYSYLVIPDDNLTGTARWNKKHCDVLR